MPRHPISAHLLLMVWLATLSSCSGSAAGTEGDAGSDTDVDLVEEACPGTCLEHDFGSVHAGAFFESDSVCLSWTVGNEEEIWVNAVEVENDGFFHHSNWFWVPDHLWDLPDGEWDCWENDFGELEAAVLGGVLFAQSTQTLGERQEFLPGAAIRLAPHARIVAYAHVLNATPEEADTSMRVRLELLDADKVAMELRPFRLTYADLHIPGGLTVAHEGTCDLAEGYATVHDNGFDLQLHYVLPHYHALGSGFRLELAGGPRDGEVIYEQHDNFGDALGLTLPEPLSLAQAGATGLRFRCEHENWAEDAVGWGIGDQEMCVMLGFAETNVLYDGKVHTTDAIETLEDGTMRRGGPCTVVSIPVN